MQLSYSRKEIVMKRFLCASLCALMIFGNTAVLPLALEADTEDREDVVCGTFEYAMEELGEGYTYNTTATYYYSDSYFSGSAKEYNPHLATMSLCLALSAFGVLDDAENTDYLSQSKNALALFGDLGFGDVTPNADMYVRPTDETMGAVAGKKQLSDKDGEYTLVALALRGGAYGAEWAENLEVGLDSDYNGNHKGFYEARDRIVAFLTDYISDLSGRVKLWVAGYSRAGAVAGLVGAWADDNCDLLENTDISISQHDVFAYTFEAPAGTARKNTVGKDYSNIHNIIGANDLVTKVAMDTNEDGGWDFVRVGEENVYNVTALSDRTTDKLYVEKTAIARKFMAELNPDALAAPENLYDESGHWDGVPVREALNYLSKTLTSGISRRGYTRSIQPFLYDVLRQVFADGQSLMRFIAVVEEVISTPADLIGLIPMPIPSEFEGDIVDVLLKNVQAVKTALSIVLEEILIRAEITYDKGELVVAVHTLVDVLADGGKDLIYLLIAIFSQEDDGVFAYHYPEIPLSYLMAQDTYYGGIDEPVPYAITRVLTVKNGGITVKDSTGKTVFAYANDTPLITNPAAADLGDMIQKPEVVFGTLLKNEITEDSVTVYLPSNEPYTVKVISGEGTEYSITEYSICDGRELRCAVFKNIPSSSALDGEIPAMSKENVALYTLSDTSGKQISVSDTAYEKTNIVTLTAPNDTVSLSGAGEYFHGQSATVSATGTECYRFSGWYIGNTLLSEECEFTFTVRRDAHLLARFDEVHNESEWIVDTEAKVGEEGKEHIECTACGLKLDERSIPAKQAPEKPVDSDSGNFYNFIIVLVAAPAVLAIGTVAVVFVLKKKKTNKAEN